MSIEILYLNVFSKARVVLGSSLSRNDHSKPSKLITFAQGLCRALPRILVEGTVGGPELLQSEFERLCSHL
jgi:hypothetical protein